MLELKNISFKVPESSSGRQVLGDISLTFSRGDLVVITGPNGSGKSTLAQIIMGIKSPTTGQLILNGEDITPLSITERAKRGIAFSFQQPVKFKGITVYDLLNIACGELISKQQARAYLAKVGLEPDDYLLREVNDKLSGGELKRIEIATTLARNAEIIIFDEPEAGIDLWSFAGLVRIFRQLQAESKTLIVISHQEKILNIADEIIVLTNGKIASHGAPDPILPQIRKEDYAHQ